MIHFARRHSFTQQLAGAIAWTPVLFAALALCSPVHGQGQPSTVRSRSAGLEVTAMPTGAVGVPGGIRLTAVTAIAIVGSILALGLRHAVNTGVVRQAARTEHDSLAGDRDGVIVVATAAGNTTEDAAAVAVTRRHEDDILAGREVGTGEILAVLMVPLL